MGNVIEIGDKVYFHPGYYISQIINETNSNIEEFSKSLGISTERLESLLNGEIPITKDDSEKLSKVLRTSPEFWMYLQKTFDKNVKI